jgi:hypothetical protein
MGSCLSAGGNGLPTTNADCDHHSSGHGSAFKNARGNIECLGEPVAKGITLPFTQCRCDELWLGFAVSNGSRERHTICSDSRDLRNTFGISTRHRLADETASQ